MKACLIGKYPPIEGGVSMNNFWTAYGLAERGHEVFVVTNADEVEPSYRMMMSDDDAPWYEARFGEMGGSVRVLTTEPFSRTRMGHIPEANPFVSKLASLATQTIRQHGCDVIFAYYYEPYAVAGFLASCWTGVPLAVKHAGSDLDRLMRVPSLATTYGEMLRGASAVLTRPSLVDRFLAIGVAEERIYADVPFGLHSDVFNPHAPPLDVAAMVRRAASAGVFVDNPSPFDPAKPTVGIYGKIGVFKGSYDLVKALAMLREEGLDFNFLAIANGVQVEQFRSEIHRAGLDDRTWILPFVPHWKVPQFIRACTCVCFLERDFPVAIHGPMVPREVLACGTSLVLSGEIARKQWFRDDLRDGENYLLIDDPKDHRALAAVLRRAIAEPEQARAIGAKGHALSAGMEHYGAFVDGYERLLAHVATTPYGPEHSRRRREHQTAQPLTALGQLRAGGGDADALRSAVADSVEDVMPWTRTVFGDQLPALVAQFVGGGVEHPNRLRLALAFCDWVEGQFAAGAGHLLHAMLDDVLRYQRAALWMPDVEQPYTQLGLHDALGDQPWSAGVVLDLHPVRSERCRIEEFAHDLTPLFTGAADEGYVPTQQRTAILFGVLPNGERFQLNVHGGIQRLWELCDGARRTQDVCEHLWHEYKLDADADKQAMLNHVVAALQRLHRRGAMIFAA